MQAHDLKLNNLDFKYFNIHEALRNENELFFKAYFCWKEGWLHALSEMQVSDLLYSDNFTKQDYLAVLYYNEEIAALATMKEYDLNNPIMSDDSYFACWLYRTQIQK